MNDNPKDGEIFPPSGVAQRTPGTVHTQSTIDRMPAASPGDIVSSTVTSFVANLRRRANSSLAADAHARADYYDAVGRVAKSYIGMNQALGEVNELDQILSLDRAERKASREEREAEIGHRKKVAEQRRNQELIEAKRGTFNAAQGFENQKRLKELNLEIWEKRKEAEHLDASAIADHLRGEVGRDSKKEERELQSELQAQTEKLEKEILEMEADGKDTKGDRMVLAQMKALIELLRGR